MKKPGKRAAYEIFAIDQKDSIRKPEHLGIFNGKIAIDTPYQDVLSFRKLIAPSYISSNFSLAMRVCGEEVKTAGYTWYPFKIEREGQVREIKVKSTLVLVDGTRSALLAVNLSNQGKQKEKIPVQINVRGIQEFPWDLEPVREIKLDYINFYEFGWPKATKKCVIFHKGQKLTRNDTGTHILTIYPSEAEVCKQTLIVENSTGAVVLKTDLKDPEWKESCSMWEASMTLAPKENRTFYVAIAIGKALDAESCVEKVIASPEKERERTDQVWDRKVKDIFDRIPTLEASDKGLVKFYNRSLTPFVLNRWEVPEFVINPWYSTGGLGGGGCIGNYLWDYGNTYGMHSLYEPGPASEHIKLFLNADLANHFAVSPDGQALGPWYPVNQEKIVALIYHHVLLTGDTGLLNEEVNGKSILDLAISHATHRDDLSKPAALINYQYSLDNYIELHHGCYYRHFVPCLNGRRCESYRMVDALCKIAGRKPPADFLKRADAIKSLLKEELWDGKARWFAWMDDVETKKKELRYTAQILKMFDTGALDKEEEDGMLSHLNEAEFLSDYGLHSMSKQDPAYDQDDIDCGGPGICSCILPLIVERLYRSGHSTEAGDILKRTLWWGTRLPYYADSQVSDVVDYRHNSPLQNCVGALSGARSIIYGMFGVKVSPESITINPAPPKWSPELKLTGLKIRGIEIDIQVDKTGYLVKVDRRRVIRSKIGVPVLIHSKVKRPAASHRA